MHLSINLEGATITKKKKWNLLENQLSKTNADIRTRGTRGRKSLGPVHIPCLRINLFHLNTWCSKFQSLSLCLCHHRVSFHLIMIYVRQFCFTVQNPYTINFKGANKQFTSSAFSVHGTWLCCFRFGAIQDIIIVHIKNSLPCGGQETTMMKESESITFFRIHFSDPTDWKRSHNLD